MATVATISVNFAQYNATSFNAPGVIDRSINPSTLSQYCLGSSTPDFNYLGGFVKKTTDTMSGYLILPSANPTLDNHATRKGYVDSRINSLSSTVSDSGNGFVKVQGSTMTGALTLDTLIPTLTLHASSKGYVDKMVSDLNTAIGTNLSNNFLAKAGGTMSGIINMGSNKIQSLATPVLATDAATKQYVDSVVGSGTAGGTSTAYVDQQDALRVAKAGDTMTGALILNANPSVNLGAATKQYVDTGDAAVQAIANTANTTANTANTTANTANTTANGKVSKTGDTMTGALILNANPNVALGAATKQYVDSVVGSGTAGGATTAYVDQQDALRVAKAGDTMTGALILNANPSVNLGAATKQYVDTNVSVAQTTANTAQTTANTANTTANTAQTTANTAQTTANGKVSKTGDTMTGALILNANPSVNLGAATKQYVDTNVSVAQTTANTANTTANTANTTANSALAGLNNKYDKTGGAISGNVTVAGTIVASGDITAFSDERLKYNVNRIENALDKTLQLNGVTFETKENKKSLGVIAQNVLNVLPEVVQENDNGYLSVAYGNIVGVLIEAIKELNAKIEKLEAKN
jgi:hypothetical protein